jgi:GNAT superfamily N-acetyltransferase
VSVTIREAVSSDAARLTELILDLGHPIDEPQVRSNLETLTGLGMLPLVATDGDEVMGMCGISAMSTVHRPAPVGRISVMIVAEQHRGRGIGALLVAEAERRLAGRGCKLIEVTSNERRGRAHRFYERLGYQRTSLRFAKTL